MGDQASSEYVLKERRQEEEEQRSSFLEKEVTSGSMYEVDCALNARLLIICITFTSCLWREGRFFLSQMLSYILHIFTVNLTLPGVPAFYCRSF